LPEKKRARRRLVGAIALVLAAVIGLPMILDSEPKPLGDDINIQIPSKETSAPTGKSAVVQKASQATVAASLNPEEEVLETATPKAEAKIETKAEVKAAEPEKKSLPPVVKADSPEAKAAAKSALAAPATAKPEYAGDAVRAKAILEGKANPAVAPKASGKLVLQVAALASQDKVNELQKKLQGAGLKSYTQKVATESGERIRVRIGPFANAAEAEKARAKLDKIGLTAKLIPA